MIAEKTVADSYTSQVQIIMPRDMNGQKRLFGGQLMQWIDVVAAVVARRHSCAEVTTASIDNLVFAAPAFMGDTVILEGRLTYVGRTSMEVRVDSFIENLCLGKKLINSAYLVMVAIGKDDKPIEVPKLKLITDEEKLEAEKGRERAKLRKSKKEHCNDGGRKANI